MAFHPEYKGCQFLGQGCHFLRQGCQFLGQGWNIESTQHLPNQSNPIPGQSSHQHAWAPGKLSLELAVTLLPLNCHQNKFRWTDRMDWPDIYWIYDDRASRGLTGWKGANLWCKPAITLSLKASQSKKTIISWKCKYHTRYSIGIPGFTKQSLDIIYYIYTLCNLNISNIQSIYVYICTLYRLIFKKYITKKTKKINLYSIDTLVPKSDTLVPKIDTLAEKLTPSSQKLTPSSQKLTPSSQKLTPSSQKLTPSSQKLTPSSQKLTPRKWSKRNDPKGMIPKEWVKRNDPNGSQKEWSQKEWSQRNESKGGMIPKEWSQRIPKGLSPNGMIPRNDPKGMISKEWSQRIPKGMIPQRNDPKRNDPKAMSQKEEWSQMEWSQGMIPKEWPQRNESKGMLPVLVIFWVFERDFAKKLSFSRSPHSSVGRAQGP